MPALEREARLSHPARAETFDDVVRAATRSERDEVSGDFADSATAFQAVHVWRHSVENRNEGGVFFRNSFIASAPFRVVTTS
jgi:hypothetical protein